MKTLLRHAGRCGCQHIGARATAGALRRPVGAQDSRRGQGRPDRLARRRLRSEQLVGVSRQRAARRPHRRGAAGAAGGSRRACSSAVVRYALSGPDFRASRARALVAAQDASRDAPAMHLRRAVVDAERAHVREDPRDDRFVRDAQAAEHLHASGRRCARAPPTQITLAMLDSCLPSTPWSSTQAQCQIARRVTCRSISLSASMKPTPSCSPSGLPNAWRSRAYAVAMSCARRAAPSQRMQCVRRAGARRTCA